MSWGQISKSKYRWKVIDTVVSTATPAAGHEIAVVRRMWPMRRWTGSVWERRQRIPKYFEGGSTDFVIFPFWASNSCLPTTLPSGIYCHKHWRKHIPSHRLPSKFISPLVPMSINMSRDPSEPYRYILLWSRYNHSRANRIRGLKDTWKESKAEGTFCESQKILKHETIRVKIICRAMTVADSRYWRFVGYHPDRRKGIWHHTQHQDLEPSVKAGMWSECVDEF